MSWVPSPSTARHLFYGIVIGFSLSFATTSCDDKANLTPIELRSDEILDGVTGLIGNTPLVRINSLSDALGVEILGKAEYLNPGGSVKDRVALRMIEDAEREGLLQPYTGSRIFEGTVGSTGISIATIAKARAIIMPDDVALEKVKALEALGADIERVRPASIVDKKQASQTPYVNLAREYALHFTNSGTRGASKRSPSSNHVHPHIVKGTASSGAVVASLTLNGNGNGHASFDEEKSISHPRGFFADQFENRSNFDAHFTGTGPEIWRQTNGEIVGFVAGAGTGGTIAGCGQFLKSMADHILVALADPEGSGLYNKVKHGVMYDRKESEGTRRRHQVDTVVEGIGINRITKNIELALPVIDDAFRITDAEAVSMARFLVQRDGMFLGSSSAVNLVACIKLVRKMGWGNGEKVVTVLDDAYLSKAGIPIDVGIVQDLLTQPFPPMSSITKI
ncbi:PALP-domain-containing protein [Russula aff. rugulosa BPL654]|nr:PALP-domain-containing protein [Russula aff. rugulosa BPL654]